MEEKISLDFNGKKIEIDLKVCNELEKVTGLMFSRREKAKALLFNFKKSTRIKLHSWFVFFPFIAIWTDDKNNVIESKIVKPFEISISPKKSFYKIIEIPFNDKYKEIVESSSREKFK